MGKDSNERQERRGNGSRRPRRAWMLVGILVVGSYTAGVLLVGGQDARQALSDAAVPPLVGTFLLQVVVLLTWPLVYRASLRAVGCDLEYAQALRVSMTAFTVSHVAPGGGAVGAAAAIERLHRFGVPGPAAAASVALTGPVVLTTIAASGAIGMAIAVVTGELPGLALAAAVAAVVVLLGLVGGIAAALRSPEFGERAIDAVGRLHRRLEQRADEWRDAWQTVSENPPTPKSLLPIAGWSSLKWTADIASLGLVFVALGERPRLVTLLVGFGVAQILSAVPLTPGAVGIFESAMAGVFTLLGTSFGLATTLAIIYRVFETWLPTLAGVPVVLRPRGGWQQDDADDERDREREA